MQIFQLGLQFDAFFGNSFKIFFFFFWFSCLADALSTRLFPLLVMHHCWVNPCQTSLMLKACPQIFAYIKHTHLMKLQPAAGRACLPKALSPLQADLLQTLFLQLTKRWLISLGCFSPKIVSIPPFLAGNKTPGPLGKQSADLKQWFSDFLSVTWRARSNPDYLSEISLRSSISDRLWLCCQPHDRTLRTPALNPVCCRLVHRLASPGSLLETQAGRSELTLLE